jgi:DNA segregation ATPase FtsK/SpoIIIE, S-DNA-T family
VFFICRLFCNYLSFSYSAKFFHFIQKRGRLRVIEWAIIPLAIGAVGLIQNKNKDIGEKEKIDYLFETLRLGVAGKKGIQLPSLINKPKRKEKGTHYVYSLPDGLPSDKVLKHTKTFSEALNEYVELEFDGVLHVRVYYNKLPNVIRYETLPAATLNTGGFKVPIGMTQKEMIWHDFSERVHMIVGGTTTFGKTNMLKVIHTHLTLTEPEHCLFYFIDMKGGVEFFRHRQLKQVKGVALNFHEADSLLKEVVEKIKERQHLFLRNGWNQFKRSPLKQRIFVVIDEAAELMPDKSHDKETKQLLESCQRSLSYIWRIGGAFGVNGIFGTQYPTADILKNQIKQTSDTRICFRLPDGYASEVVLGEGNTQASQLPEDIRGRAIYKTHNFKELQVPYMDNDKMWELLGRYYKYEAPIEVRATVTKNREDFIHIG